MWNWLFVQTLLRLHKDLDKGRHQTQTQPDPRLISTPPRDPLLDFYLFGMPPRGKISGFEGAEKHKRSGENQESDARQDERMNLETDSALEKLEVSRYFI